MIRVGVFRRYILLFFPFYLSIYLVLAALVSAVTLCHSFALLSQHTHTHIYIPIATSKPTVNMFIVRIFMNTRNGILMLFDVLNFIRLIC